MLAGLVAGNVRRVRLFAPTIMAVGLGSSAGLAFPFVIAARYGKDTLVDSFFLALALSAVGVGLATIPIETNALAACKRAAQDGYDPAVGTASWGTEKLNANCGKKAFTGKLMQTSAKRSPTNQ